MKANQLSRRERQIMDIIYELDEATAQQVMERLPEPPGYSAVRALLRKLVDKGQLAYREQGAKYVYYPLVGHEKAGHNAITRLIRTFYDGSAGQAVNAMLGMSLKDISQEELDQIEGMIREAKRRKRKRGGGE